MFGLFRAPVVEDPAIGPLKHARGHWRGTLAIGGVPTPLALFSSRSAPDEAALAAARLIQPSYDGWKPAIAQALFEHLEPYTDRAGTPAHSQPGDVWAQVTLDSVAVIRLGGILTTDLVYAVAWDEEHLVGARFQSGRFIELCGSVLPA
ncbi:MAG: hypothetical protein V4653_08730 [Pseudomonadota bacterium]